jgi:hypothetical protein
MAERELYLDERGSVRYRMLMGGLMVVNSEPYSTKEAALEDLSRIIANGPPTLGYIDNT